MSWFNRCRQPANDALEPTETAVGIQPIALAGEELDRQAIETRRANDAELDDVVPAEHPAQELGSAESEASAAPDPLSPEPATLEPLAILANANHATDTQAANWTNIVQRLDDVSLCQSQLKELFESRLHSDQVQVAAIQQLHQQLQDYKANFIRQALLPVLKDIIQCCDFVATEITRIESSSADRDNDDGTLAHLQQMLLDVLFKYDVEPFSNADDSYDRATQHCIELVPTTVAGDDLKVATRRLPGFQSGATILRKEQVSVYKLTTTS